VTPKIQTIHNITSLGASTSTTYKQQPCSSSSPMADLEKGLGNGSIGDPYVVEWYPVDPEDPYNWPDLQKWIITAQLALATWTVSFSSSAYTGGLEHTMRDLHVSYNVATLGISLYVLGFALGSVLILFSSFPVADLP